MKNCFINRRFLNIFLLISLVGFLVLPNTALANDFGEIAPEEMGKYLELSAKDAQKLLDTLIQVLTKEGINLWGSGYSTDEEIAVVEILRKVARIDVLNHLLIDAPIEITGKIIKSAIEIARLLIAQDVSVVLEKFEKETVKKAVEYGTNFLLQNEIKVTPGAIEFEYISYKGNKQEVVFQYLIIYKPLDAKSGKVEIRFYSLTSIEPTKSEGSIGYMTGTPHNLRHDLPPFIVEINGVVENYNWTSQPSIKITFPETVPDFGIKPLTFWERQLLKPLVITIKEIKVIITKVIGKSPKIAEDILDISQIATDIWHQIKSSISQVRLFGAGLVTVPELEILEKQLSEVKPPTVEEGTPSETKPESQSETTEPEITLAEIQERLDDIAERIDILSQKATEFIEAQSQFVAEVSEEVAETEEASEEPEEIVEEEEVEEREEEVGQEEAGQEVEQEFCKKIPGSWPARSKVIINEVAWMGTISSANDEWIELKNISSTAVDLTGWQLIDKDQQMKIILSGILPAGDFYLLERINDDSVPNVPADLIYTGALNNTNEVLYLFDKDCRLEDEVIADPNWPAGDNSSKRTMERKSNLGWQSSLNPGGTPKIENSSGYVYYGGGGGVPSPPPEEPSEPTICSQENLSSPTQFPVIINEIAWLGTSASLPNDEWIELKNISESPISLQNWQLLDKDQQIKIVFEAEDIVPVNGFYLLERSDDNSVPNIPANKIYAGALNNQGDSLRLFNQDCQLIDEVVVESENDLAWLKIGEGDQRKSMERSDDLSLWHPYWGSEPDSVSGLMGTPKAENSQPEEAPPEENQPPTAQFTYTPENPIVNQEIIFDASSSTDPDGTITAFLWDFSNGNSTTTNLTTTTHSFVASGEFLVQLLVQDNQGTTSSPATTIVKVTESKLAQNVIITEVQIEDKEFIELYNPTEEITSIANWYLSYFSANREWNNPTITWEFLATSSIEAKSHYLIGIYGYPETKGNPNANWEILTKSEPHHPYQTGQLSNSAGAIGIFSCNPKETTTSEEAMNCKIDLFSWEEENATGTLVFEGNSFPFKKSELEGKSFQRKKSEGFYIDTDNNSRDFEIRIPSPTNSKGETGDILPPEPVENLRIATSINNTLSLAWSTTTDPDTSEENISYIIYYSKEGEITEANLDATTTLIATTTASTLVISDLYYNSTYYFRIKAFDGYHYSPLSTASLSYQIPSAWENSSWPMFRHDPQHTGQSPLLGLETEKSVIKKILGENIVIDPNQIVYSIIPLWMGRAVVASYPDGIQKWIYEIPDQVSSPALGPDGTIYVLTYSGKIIALSPAGKLKWEMSFSGYPQFPQKYFNASPLIKSDGDIYFTFNLSLSNGNLEPCLITLKDFSEEGKILWIYALREEKVYNNLETLLGEPGQGGEPSSISLSVIDNQGNIYIGYGNTLFVLDSEGNQIGKRVFPSRCGKYYSPEECYPTITNLSIDENNKILYILINQEEDFKTLQDAGGVNCLHNLNLEDIENENWRVCLSGLLGLLPISPQGDVYFQRRWDWFKEVYSYTYQGTKNWSIFDSGSLLLDREGNIYLLSGSILRIFDKDGEQIWP